jgi:hypothetical protein
MISINSFPVFAFHETAYICVLEFY